MTFKPEVRRVKLSPEQAILTCLCYKAGLAQTPSYYFLGVLPQAFCVEGTKNFGGHRQCEIPQEQGDPGTMMPVTTQIAHINEASS